MKNQRFLLILYIVLATGLAACTSGHLGNNILTFLKNGYLWTVDPDGANAFAIVEQSSPVVGYAWSPDHHILAFRTQDTSTPLQAVNSGNPGSETTMIGDTSGTINTIGVDGGTPIETAFSNSTVHYGNPQWEPGGTHIIYRQTLTSASGNPTSINWWIAQNDQPGGIASQLFPGTYSIPSFSYDLTKPLLVGNDAKGIFTTTIAATQRKNLTREGLIGHPLAASLERILWRPEHGNTDFVYALSQGVTAEPTNETPSTIELMLGSTRGTNRLLTTCTCTQFAWSPDGSTLLYTENATTYTLLNVNTGASFSLTDEIGSVPYWSPDSHFLILDGTDRLTLISMATHQQTILLDDRQENTTQPASILPTTEALLQPVSNNIWANDSLHFLFITNNRTIWQNQARPLANGLYTITITAQGQLQGNPTLVDSGKDSQAGWSYEDPNTSFLYQAG